MAVSDASKPAWIISFQTRRALRSGSPVIDDETRRSAEARERRHRGRGPRRLGRHRQQVVLPGTGMVPIGIATVEAGNGVATVRIRLDGVATEAA